MSTPPSPACRIGGLTFDLDDTLYDNRPVLARAESLLHAWLERHYPRLALAYDPDRLRAVRQRLVEEVPALRHDVTALRKGALAVAAAETGYDPGLAERAFQVFWHARNQVQLHAEVRPTLLRLRQRYRLGAVTNGNADVGRLGLGDLFEFTLCAADVGASKPDPTLFREALRRLGAEPRSVVHVGDDAHADVSGARGAGLRAVWVNRQGTPWLARDRPDAEVRSLGELPAVIERLEREG
jgi:putative hydrolase of the HAD superfamily